MKVTDLAAILGMVLGTAGFTLSLFNYFRDRAEVKVALKWDMTELPGDAAVVLIRVTNVGRRPIYITSVALKVPGDTYLLIKRSSPGQKLSEGDAPVTYPLRYSELKLGPYAKHWRDVRN